MLFNSEKHSFSLITKPLAVSFTTAMMLWLIGFLIFGDGEPLVVFIYSFATLLIGVIASNVQERKRNWSLIEIIMLVIMSVVGILVPFFVLEYLGYFQLLLSEIGGIFIN